MPSEAIFPVFVAGLPGRLVAQPKPTRAPAAVHEAMGEAKYGGFRAWGNKRMGFCGPRVCSLLVHGKLHQHFGAGHYCRGVDISRMRPGFVTRGIEDGRLALATVSARASAP